MRTGPGITQYPRLNSLAVYMAELEPVPDAVKPGAIVVLHYDDSKGRMFYITIKQVVGPIKGRGWLVFTRTGRLCLVTLGNVVEGKSEFFGVKLKTGEPHFVFDTDTANRLLKEAGATIREVGPNDYQIEYPYEDNNE